MRLELHRYKMTPRATFGRLLIDGKFECLTLEDVVRDLGPNGEGKVQNETAIPAGTYEVIVNMSPRLGKLMPRLLNVPFFDGILIHCGNKSEDTHGCILLGCVEAGEDLLTGSTVAFARFFPKLVAELQAGEVVQITVTNDFKEAA